MKKTLLKKAAGLAAVLALAAAVFSGCAGTQSATEGQYQPTTEPQQATVSESTEATEGSTASISQNTGAISLEQAKTIALEYVGISPLDTEIYKAELDGGLYEIEFVFDGYDHEVDVSRTTGEVINYKKEALKSTAQNNQGATQEGTQGATQSTTQSPVQSSGDLTMAEAKTIALNYVGAAEADAVVYEVHLDNGVYEIEFYAGDFEYEVKVSKATGEVLKVDKDNCRHGDHHSTYDISADYSEAAATSAAFEHAGVTEDSVYDLEISLEAYKGYYEIEFKANGYEYEYDVAFDGSVLKWEKDRA